MADITLLGYFLVGILQDFLVTMNFRCIAKNKVVPAVGTSFLLTMLSMVSLYNILTSLDKQRSLVAIIVYAVGISVGTYLGMLFDLDKMFSPKKKAKENKIIVPQQASV